MTTLFLITPKLYPVKVRGLLSVCQQFSVIENLFNDEKNIVPRRLFFAAQ
jgi:hypothetical protein